MHPEGYLNTLQALLLSGCKASEKLPPFGGLYHRLVCPNFMVSFFLNSLRRGEEKTVIKPDVVDVLPPPTQCILINELTSTSKHPQELNRTGTLPT